VISFCDEDVLGSAPLPAAPTGVACDDDDEEEDEEEEEEDEEEVPFSSISSAEAPKRSTGGLDALSRPLRRSSTSRRNTPASFSSKVLIALCVRTSEMEMDSRRKTRWPRPPASGLPAIAVDSFPSSKGDNPAPGGAPATAVWNGLREKGSEEDCWLLWSAWWSKAVALPTDPTTATPTSAMDWRMDEKAVR